MRSNNAILYASKLTYDKELKLVIISGNIKFNSEDSYLEASDIEYDFVNKNKCCKLEKISRIYLRGRWRC